MPDGAPVLTAAPGTRLDADFTAAASAPNGCQASCGSRPTWCAVVTHAQAERRAAASLHRYGFEPYLPLITVRWADRTWHTQPLFRRYCFVRIDLSRGWSPIMAAPGVFQLVSFDGTKPATCSDAVIQAVRDAVDGFDAFRGGADAWKPGQPCSLATGPLRGWPAVVTSVSRDTATVAILMFGALREVSVAVDCLTRRDD